MSSTADASPSAPPSVPPERPSALAPLRHPIFRAVWITSLVTNFGGLIQSVGATFSAPQRLTRQPDARDAIIVIARDIDAEAIRAWAPAAPVEMLA